MGYGELIRVGAVGSIGGVSCIICVDVVCVDIASFGFDHASKKKFLRPRVDSPVRVELSRTELVILGIFVNWGWSEY